jgi:hypothetical protein
VTVPDLIADARSLMQSRLAEIQAEATKLERALASLGEGSSRRRLGRPRRAVAASSSIPRRRPARKVKSAKRAARGQRRDELLVAIAATPGARPSDLARSIGVKPAQVHALIARARTEKLLVKSGKGYALTGKGSRAAG